MVNAAAMIGYRRHAPVTANSNELSSEGIRDLKMRFENFPATPPTWNALMSMPLPSF